MSIIQLTSLDWSRKERFGVVGHSFRVMAKAKNYDEMVVGLMHAIYAGSSYARALFSIDVDGDPEWETALKLFVPPLKMNRPKSRFEVPDEDLLGVNMPRGLSDEAKREWMVGETVWNSSDTKLIRKIRGNSIARNVMIYKLEDILDVLRNPGKYEDESGPQYYVLPWKKHYRVDVRNVVIPVPRTEDALLLRDPTELERKNLIGKYSNALEILQDEEFFNPVYDDYTEEEHRKHEEGCHKWFLSWMAEEKADMERYGEEVDDDEDEYDVEELPY